jgi:hypothetical protein
MQKNVPEAYFMHVLSEVLSSNRIAYSSVKQQIKVFLFTTQLHTCFVFGGSKQHIN